MKQCKQFNHTNSFLFLFSFSSFSLTHPNKQQLFRSEEEKTGQQWTVFQHTSNTLCYHNQKETINATHFNNNRINLIFFSNLQLQLQQLMALNTMVQCLDCSYNKDFFFTDIKNTLAALNVIFIKMLYCEIFRKKCF